MKINFTATLSDVSTAISIDADGATRVKFDIPESDLAEAMKLVLFKGQAFKVTVETLNQNKDKDKWLETVDQE